ncbi:coproporphyrinogen III oxidase [Arcobacter peruensis]|uniref:coproporphyrinogen III oxidase n=1 Tax=Arcobacter peruensis TaxID=2320140 RepID=UPI000F077EEB|nr:coproporphyrinogen III oxidase [Arcobacter peruensis]
MIKAKSQDAIKALSLVTSLQNRFVKKLDNLSKLIGEDKKFEEVVWLRDEGLHGGGNRFEARDKTLFNTASVNVSQVHYDEDESKKLQSATAISTIIHPKNPNVPSIHIHISLTQIRGNDSYWRVMADLNPSINNIEDKEIFEKSLKELSQDNFEEGIKQGDKYFNIPALNRHRGISHFYLENYKTSKKEDDFNFANNFGEGIIDTYINIISNAFETRKEISSEDIQKQLDYHTLYLFQVLTLDRGTTSGLLVHSQNDIGIMGSLPSFINKDLLKSWEKNVEKPQDVLVSNLVKVINDEGKVDSKTKEKLANEVRTFYKKYPQALSKQASGNTIPSTVSNHKG